MFGDTLTKIIANMLTLTSELGCAAMTQAAVSEMSCFGEERHHRDYLHNLSLCEQLSTLYN